MSTRTARCIWLNWRWISPASVLAPGGDFLVKVFQGRDFQPFVRQLRGLFGTVKVRKPPASRQRSPELYLLARDL